MLKIILCKILAWRTTVLMFCTIFNFHITFIVKISFSKVPQNRHMIFHFSNLFSTIPIRILSLFTVVDRLTAKITFLTCRPCALIVLSTYGPCTLCLLLICNFMVVLLDKLWVLTLPFFVAAWRYVQTATDSASLCTGGSIASSHVLHALSQQ